MANDNEPQLADAQQQKQEQQQAAAPAAASATKKKNNNKKKKKNKKAKRHSVFDHVQVARTSPLSRALLAALDQVAEAAETSDADCLLTKVNQASPTFPFKLVDLQDGVGRRAVAARDIVEGELLLQELPLVWTVFRNQLGRMCSGCAQQIQSPQQRRPCVSCRSVCYCSAKCEQADARRHTLLCPVKARLPQLSETFEVDPNMLAICLEFLAELVYPTSDRSCEAPWFRASLDDVRVMTAHEMPPEIEQQGALVAAELCKLVSESHQALTVAKSPAPASESSSSSSADGGGVSEKVDLDSSLLQRFMRIVNNNSHELLPPMAFGGGDSDDSAYGLGVFPLGAIFNHSCQPNSIYVAANHAAQVNTIGPNEVGPKRSSPSNSFPSAAGGGKGEPLPPQLCFRALRGCKRGEELAVSYIDLYASRATRTQNLWVTKQFMCRCERCMLQPKAEIEMQQFLNDRLTGGVMCPSCNLSEHQPDAVLAEVRVSEDQPAALLRTLLVHAQAPLPEFLGAAPDSSTTEVEEEDDDDEKEPVEEAAAAAAAAIAAGTKPPAAFKPVLYMCLKCGQEATQKFFEQQEQAQQLAQQAGDLYWEAANSANSNGGHGHSHGGQPCGGHGHSHGDSQPAMTPDRALKQMVSLVERLQLLVHPDHELVYHQLHPLANLASRAGDFKLRHETLKRLIDTSVRQWPANFLPLARMYLAGANATAQLMKSRQSARLVPKKLLLRLREERLEFMQKALRVVEVCRGVDDPATELLRSRLEEVTRERV